MQKAVHSPARDTEVAGSFPEKRADLETESISLIFTTENVLNIL
jgi:hypothetical protein